MSSFSNKGFKSLPLNVQKKIMKSSRKLELGGNGVLDPNYDTVEKIQAAYSSGAITEQQADIYQKAIDDAGGQYYTGLEGLGLTQADLKPMPEKMSQSLLTKDHNLARKEEFNPMESMTNMSPYVLGLLKKDLSDKAKIKEGNFGEEWTPEAYTRRGQTFPSVPTTGPESAQFKEYRNVLNKEWHGQGKPLQNELNLGQFKYGGNMYPNGSTLNPMSAPAVGPNLVEEGEKLISAYSKYPKGFEPKTASGYAKKLTPKEATYGFDLGYLNSPATEEFAKFAETHPSMYALYAQTPNVKASGGMMSNKYAMGAQMPQGQMTDIPVTEFNAGGSHEANAVGGVYQGMANNGKPNLVEQGELKITIPGTDEQFIVSPKIKLDKATAEEFGLNKKHVGKDMVKIFKSLLRKNNFAEREGDSIVENSKQLEIMPYVAAHQKLTEIKNVEDTAKKQEAFDKDMGEMMEKHPEYMQALLAPKEQGGPSPEEMAMMQQAPAGMPPMMRNGGMYRNGGNKYAMGGWEIADKALSTLGTAVGSIPLGWTNAVGAGLSGLGAAAGQIGEQKELYESTGERMKLNDVDWGAVGIDAAAGAGAGATGALGSAAINAGANVIQDEYNSKAELAVQDFQKMLENNPNSPEALQRKADAEKMGAKETNPYADAAAGVGLMALEQGAEKGADYLMENSDIIAGAIMRNGGMKGGCGRGCNCFKCGGKMHANGGNMFAAGGFDPLELQETFDYITALQNSENKEEEEKIMDTSLEEGIKDVTVEGGIGSSLLQLAPAVSSGIMAFSKPETYNAGDLGYREITAPKISYSEAKKDAKQQAAGVAKDIKNVGGAGYLSNRIANAQNAAKIIAQISQQEENANKQLQYQNALRNQGNYQGAAAQAAMMTAQALAAKAKAGQDFGATLGSLGSKLAADQMGAGYANIYSPDINFKYNPLGKSILGKTETNKTEKKSKKKST